MHSQAPNVPGTPFAFLTGIQNESIRRARLGGRKLDGALLNDIDGATSSFVVGLLKLELEPKVVFRVDEDAVPFVLGHVLFKLRTPRLIQTRLNDAHNPKLEVAGIEV